MPSSGRKGDDSMQLPAVVVQNQKQSLMDYNGAEIREEKEKVWDCAKNTRKPREGGGGMDDQWQAIYNTQNLRPRDTNKLSPSAAAPARANEKQNRTAVCM